MYAPLASCHRELTLSTKSRQREEASDGLSLESKQILDEFVQSNFRWSTVKPPEKTARQQEVRQENGRKRERESGIGRRAKREFRAGEGR
jgi:hypothetical protein